jgi:hypothetical protein
VTCKRREQNEKTMQVTADRGLGRGMNKGEDSTGKKNKQGRRFK